MSSGTMTYNKCACQKCGNHYATVIAADEELAKESCPNCGAKELKLVGVLSQAEINSLFYSGG
jgi:predicted  nucleic acid-binding Zn-ribbon protein